MLVGKKTTLDFISFEPSGSLATEENDEDLNTKEDLMNFDF
jgi:hypothetical protein